MLRDQLVTLCYESLIDLDNLEMVETYLAKMLSYAYAAGTEITSPDDGQAPYNLKRMANSILMMVVTNDCVPQMALSDLSNVPQAAVAKNLLVAYLELLLTQQNKHFLPLSEEACILSAREVVTLSIP